MPTGYYERKGIWKNDKKRCAKCKEYKLPSEFRKDFCYCRSCDRLIAREKWLKKNNKSPDYPYKPYNPHNRKIGARRIDDGYMFINMGKGEWKAEHRLVMEKYLGRNLTKNEEVHHIDGNKINNILTNLFLFNKNEHSRNHLNLVLELNKLRWENKWLKNAVKKDN